MESRVQSCWYRLIRRAKASASARVPEIALAVLILAVCTANLAWIRQDSSPMRFPDVYVYMALLLEYVDDFELASPAELWTSLAKLSKVGRPPLYQLLSAPLVPILGSSEDALLGVNFLFLALLMISTYHIGRLTAGRGAGLLAALLAVCYPPVILLSRVYLPHFALVAWSALSIWLSLELLQKRSRKLAWLSGTVLALGLWIHPLFALVAVVPAIAVGVYMTFLQVDPVIPARLGELPRRLIGKLRQPFFAGGLLPAALIAVILALPWYRGPGRLMFELQQRLQAQALADFRQVEVLVRGFPEVAGSFWWYALTAPKALSNVLAALAAGGLVVAAMKRRPASWLLVVTFVAGYVLQSRRGVFVWWYFAPLLPVAAALTAAAVVELPRKWLARSLTAVCILVAVFSFSFVSWGERAWNRPIATALGAPLGAIACRSVTSAAFCPFPPRDDHWPMRQILQTIFDDPDFPRNRPGRFFFVKGFAVSDKIFTYLLARDWPELRLRIDSQISRYMGHPYPLSRLLDADYLLYRLQVSERISVNGEYFNATQKLLNAPPAAFADSHAFVARFQLPSLGAWDLIKRTRPLTAVEAEAVTTALELEDRYKSERDALLGRLRAKVDSAPSSRPPGSGG